MELSPELELAATVLATGLHSMLNKRSYGDTHKWSGKRGSNPRPPAWEAGALPTELLPRWSV